MNDTPPLRKIIHVDMDAFYASVEQRDNPELRGKPVVVGGNPGSRSVVCSASYEARKFGVRSAIPCSHAKRLCPSAIFVPPHFDRYREVSRKIREIFLRHTPLVEPLSLDEAYLDVTHELTGLPTATATAEYIRQAIVEETRLTASAGVAPNKFLAKIASDWRKPNGIFVIKPHHVEAFLVPLKVAKLPGVGKAMEESLLQRNITTVGELRELSLEVLVDAYGKFGRRLWELARGIDDRPVVPEREAKSISNEVTFDRDLTFDEVSVAILEVVAGLWKSVSKKQRAGKTVTVKLRAGDFHTETRQLTRPAAVTSEEEIVETARQLLGRFSFVPGTRYRLLGVGLSGFVSDEDPQPSLFVSPSGEIIE